MLHKLEGEREDEIRDERQTIDDDHCARGDDDDDDDRSREGEI